MATINYNGMELEEVTEPQIFDPPRKCVVFDSYDEEKSVIRNVVAVLPASFNECGGSVITEEKQYWKHCAILPDPPKPRRATNRELAKWLAQGNGEVLTLMRTANRNPREMVETAWHYFSGEYNDTVDYGFEGQRCKGVRKWGDTEWHTPDVEYMGIEE